MPDQPAGIARSTRFAPSSDGLAFEYLTVHRASRSFWQFGGLALPILGNAPFFDVLLFGLGVALLGRRDNRGVDDLSAHREKAGLRQRRVKAREQNLDRRLAVDLRPRQRLTKVPDRVRVRHVLSQRQPQEAHERKTVLDQIFRPLVR